MPTYLPFRYSSRSAYPAGLASSRSLRAARRRRSMLGQDDSGFTNYLPVDISSPGPIAVAPVGSIDVTEPAVPGILYDPYTQQPLTAAQQAGTQSVVPITGIPGKPGVTYTSTSTVPTPGAASKFSTWAAQKNSVLGISNSSLLIGAGAIALLAAAAGGKR